MEETEEGCGFFFSLKLPYLPYVSTVLSAIVVSLREKVNAK